MTISAEIYFSLATTTIITKATYNIRNKVKKNVDNI